MSGGVDSAVAAALLQQAGHDVVGITMHLWTDEKGQEMSLNRASGCCSINMANDAAAVAESMGFRHYVLDLSKEFHTSVVKNFGAEYLAGRTPNPCIRCNTLVKWQTLLERAKLIGCDFLATGHYARTERRGNRVALLRAKYLEKDQSYALWGLSQDSLSRTMFPVGDLEKSEVRRIARELKLAPAEHPESQDICFVPDDDYRRFLNDNFGVELAVIQGGEIVGPQGKVLGFHTGITNYTIGQRRGLGIAADRPLYVTKIDPRFNRVHVDYDENCVSSVAYVQEMNWVAMAETTNEFRCTAKIRYRDEGHAATVIPMDDGKARIEFDEPVRAITPGQSAVFYKNDTVLAGGLLYDLQLED